jgi:osmoprotectant transport system permease protein
MGSTAPSRTLPLVFLAHAGVLARLPLLSEAPNRLLSGKGKSLLEALAQGGSAWLAAAAVWALLGGLLVLYRQLRPAHTCASYGLLAWFAVLVWALCAVSGQVASAHQTQTEGLGRATLSSGFWLTLVLVWLGANETLRGLRQTRTLTPVFWASLVAGLLALLALGQLDALSTLKEYANRQEDFARGLRQHLGIIGLTVLITVATGLPLGIWLHRHRPWAARVFPLLSLVQTIPSIALFGLLMALLAWLGSIFPLLPAWGIQGIGLAPAVVALTFYSLLPLVRSTYEGLGHVPAAASESAQAMGMSDSQRLWQVELPLAAPVIVSGLKVMLIQTIGLAAVAALIGAGGLGSLMFEGLFSSALDLVILAVVPIVLLAWCAEALFAAIAAVSPSWIHTPP